MRFLRSRAASRLAKARPVRKGAANGTTRGLAFALG